MRKKSVFITKCYVSGLLPSRTSYGKLEDLGTPVCRECCITEYKHAVRTNVCTEQYFTTISTGQDIHLFLPNIVDDNGGFNIVY